MQYGASLGGNSFTLNIPTIHHQGTGGINRNETRETNHEVRLVNHHGTMGSLGLAIEDHLSKNWMSQWS